MNLLDDIQNKMTPFHTSIDSEPTLFYLETELSKDVYYSLYAGIIKKNLPIGFIRLVVCYTPNAKTPTELRELANEFSTVTQKIDLLNQEKVICFQGECNVSRDGIHGYWSQFTELEDKKGLSDAITTYHAEVAHLKKNY